jgi:ribonuclease HI
MDCGYQHVLTPPCDGARRGRRPVALLDDGMEQQDLASNPGRTCQREGLSTLGSVELPSSGEDRDQCRQTPGHVGATVEPLELGVLSARREVVLANRRARKAAKPAYVNTDASWRDGLAGLAYVGALGTRTEVVVYADNHAGEYLAHLMAMQDAERCLGGKIAFRMDSQTVVNLQAGSKGQFEHLRAWVKLLLARHPDWTLVLAEGNRNKIADNLSRRAFRQTDKLGTSDGAADSFGKERSENA